MAARDLEYLVERARKLLALATSRNPHEAALAAAKARDLLARHNLSLATVEAGPAGGDRPAYISERFDSGGWMDWRRRLLATVVRHHACRGVSYGGTRDVGVVGEPHNVAAVRHLYAFLVGEIARLAEAGAGEQPNLDPGDARAWKRSFYQGAVRTIAWRLSARRRQDEAADPHAAALVVSKERELDEAYYRHFPDAPPAVRPEGPPAGRARPAPRTPRSADGYRAGARAARRIPLDPLLDRPRGPVNEG